MWTRGAGIRAGKMPETSRAFPRLVPAALLLHLASKRVIPEITHREVARNAMCTFLQRSVSPSAMCSASSFIESSFFASFSTFDLPRASGLGLLLVLPALCPSWLISATASAQKTCLRHLELQVSPLESPISPTYPVLLRGFVFCFVLFFGVQLSSCHRLPNHAG